MECLYLTTYIWQLNILYQNAVIMRPMFSQHFSSSHVRMWELDYKESWVLKNWCFWTEVLEKTQESLGMQGIQPVHPKWNQSWIFIGRTDAEAKTQILWPSDAMNWLIWKESYPGRVRRWEEKGMTEDERVGLHHWLNGHEFEQAPGVGDGQVLQPGVLQSMGLQTVGHDWATELNWTEPTELQS